MSLESFARSTLSRKYKPLLHGKFRKTVEAAVWETVTPIEWRLNGDYESEDEARGELASVLTLLRPDAYLINDASHTSRKCVVTCFEIEDTNPLCRERLWRYCDAFLELDKYSWTLWLVTTNRYGDAEQYHHLPSVFVSLIDSEPESD